MTFTIPDPPASSYPWKTGLQIFGYPLVTVFAANSADADRVAGAQYGRAKQRAYCELAMDSAEAQIRLGIFGRPDLAAKIRKGD